ncbi:Helix-turn-helix protein [Clostridioides difficile]|nr:Helix-turn-helix protein [Clostridioides difficile]
MLTKEIIGLRIKQSREIKEITQQEMVKSLEELDCLISRETLSKIENGNRSVSALELNKICEILNVKVEEILEDEGDDLVKLFRTKKEVNDLTLTEIEDIQYIIISFINQKLISKREI